MYDNNRDTLTELISVSNQHLVPKNYNNTFYSFVKGDEEPKSRKQKEEETFCIMKVELDQGTILKLSWLKSMKV